MRIRKLLILLAVTSMLTVSAQAASAACYVQFGVPTGYRGVDCTYTVYVNGNEVCSGSTGGASTIKVPDQGNCSYKIVYSQKTTKNTTSTAGTGSKNTNSSTSNQTCVNGRSAKYCTSNKCYYGYRSCPVKQTSKPTVKPTVAPTAKPTAAPTAKPTVAPTAKPTAAPTANPTAAPTAKPTQAPTSNSGSNSSSMANEVVRQVNEERAKYGLPALSVDSDLTAAAQVRAAEIVKTFSHTRPDGSSWSTVSSKARGENIAKGQKTADKVMAAWMSSEGHRANILRESFKTIGVAAYEVNGIMYWVQLFGS